MEAYIIPFIAIATLVISIAVKLVGYPLQIKKLRATKDAESFSRPLFILMPIAHFFWLLHGCVLGDYVIIINSCIGIITSVYLLMLILKFSAKKTKNANTNI